MNGQKEFRIVPTRADINISRLAAAAQTAVSSPLSDKAYASVQKRDTPGFATGEPIDGKGKGGPILGERALPRLSYPSYTDDSLFTGGTNHQLDLQNPANLASQSTDAGTVVNLKWSFSDSKAKIFNGGWTREQVITDLPASHDISAAQQHLKKGALRELHWHRVVSLGKRTTD